MTKTKRIRVIMKNNNEYFVDGFPAYQFERELERLSMKPSFFFGMNDMDYNRVVINLAEISEVIEEEEDEE